MKTLATSIAITVTGLILIGLFHASGGHVDSEGVLQELFYLLPIGHLLVITGGMATLVGLIREALARVAQPA